RLLLDAGEEFRAVLGRTTGFGGDQPRLPDLARAELVGADLQRLDGAVHGRPAETAGRGPPLAQPHDAREGVDDAELAGPARHVDEKPAVVGAEIERGVDRQMAVTLIMGALFGDALFRWALHERRALR